MFEYIITYVICILLGLLGGIAVVKYLNYMSLRNSKLYLNKLLINAKIKNDAEELNNILIKYTDQKMPGLIVPLTYTYMMSWTVSPHYIIECVFDEDFYLKSLEVYFSRHLSHFSTTNSLISLEDIIDDLPKQFQEDIYLNIHLFSKSQVKCE